VEKYHPAVDTSYRTTICWSISPRRPSIPPYALSYEGVLKWGIYSPRTVFWIDPLPATNGDGVCLWNDLAKSGDIIPAIRTDHDAISIEIEEPENEQKGPGC